METPAGIPRRFSQGTAAYLRCYPYDPGAMMHHLQALKAYARYLNLPAPVLYFDNGRRTYRPEYDRLVRFVAAGLHTTILVPGPWALALDPALADERLQQLGDRGCRIIELPRPPWPGAGSLL